MLSPSVSKQLYTPKERSCRRAFTLIELLTVIAIIGILAAIVLPVISQVRRSARKAQDMGVMRVIGMQMIQYAMDNQGKINWFGFEKGNPSTGLENTFWGRAWPYLTNTKLKSLSSDNMKNVARAYLSPTIVAERDYLISETDGIYYTIALNALVVGDKEQGTEIRPFRKIENIPSPSRCPYAAIGRWGFRALEPKPLPKDKTESKDYYNAYWLYDEKSTVVTMMDGSTKIWKESVSEATLTNYAYR